MESESPRSPSLESDYQRYLRETLRQSLIAADNPQTKWYTNEEVREKVAQWIEKA